jgi:outer membrane protein OmpA-like peptidoglycan-associated protein
MANLDVQPKKRGGTMMTWILLAIGLLLLLVLLAKGCSGEDHDADSHATDTMNVSHAEADHTADGTAATAAGTWNDVDFNAPAVRYEEITNRDIEVRGNDRYGIYGLGENVLFDKGSAEIKKDAEANLQQISASIGQRYKDGEIAIFGFTDSTGGAEANMQLAQQRAEAVRNWLSAKGNISNTNISVQSLGENKPTASNATEAGREQNRRVNIVARSKAAH